VGSMRATDMINPGKNQTQILYKVTEQIMNTIQILAQLPKFWLKQLDNNMYLSSDSGLVSCHV
jgi:predicted aconitase with swiveling domain